ncbi:MAG: glycoside hydrolase family 5 protein, partial [Treponema sp.]|nr:glycoside hydrolase family 5 protein [Treponema sp.]
MAVVFSACNTSSPSRDNIINNITETGPVNAVYRTAPFSRGVNFSLWFDADEAEKINFTHYLEQDFINLKSLGADVIRLPVRFHSMTSGAPDYTLDPLLLMLLDMALDWAEKHELYLIINNAPANLTSDDMDNILLPVWAQIAQRYRNRSEFIIYEILNEPHDISDQKWGEMQGKAIETIRRYDQRHWIVAGGADYNSVSKLSSIPVYSDQKLLYTFHFYDPFLFTHQGASWTPPLEYLSGVPFPADRRRMPNIDRRLRGTWVETALRTTYFQDAQPSKLLETLDKAVAFSRERNVPVYCGEYGVFIPVSPPQDRVIWYEFITNALDRRKIPRTSWDYFGGFGIFNSDGRRDFNTELNVDIVRALGFNPPAQITRVTEPLRSGFNIFDDFPNVELFSSFWGDNDVNLSFYETNTAEGTFAIRWENPGRYNSFFFAFPRNGDFSELAASGYCLEFFARTDKPVQFDIRFQNIEDASTIPWRMSYM